MNYISFNGEILPSNQAVLKAGDLAVHRGYGIFDFFRCQNSQPLLWEDHLDRFFNSASGLKLNPVFHRDQLKAWILELLERNTQSTCGVKLTLTGGYAKDSYTPATPNLLITLHSLSGPSEMEYRRGTSIRTHEYQREFPELKTINYLRGIYLNVPEKASHLEHVLYYWRNRITECPRSNFFAIDRDGLVVTPKRNILKGITRKSVLLLSGALAREEDISIDQLPQMQEAFITSTTKGILPVVEIDGQMIGNGQPGPRTMEIRNALQEFESKGLTAIPDKLYG